LLERASAKALLIWDLVDPSALGYYRKLSRPVDGWLTRREEAALFHLARTVPRERVIVELGSWFGRSAILLGGGSRHGGGAAVFAVDLFSAAGVAKPLLEERAGDAARDYWEQFQANIRAAGLDGVVTAIRSETKALAANWTGLPVGLLFIDADHSYQGVSGDWNSWKPRLAPRARVAFHDYQNPQYEGVTRFVDQLLATDALSSVERHDSLLVGEVAHELPAG
jgi:predicted O-methyltransferase YrrM